MYDNPVILFVSHKYPPATGGMERQSFELINGMKNRAQTFQIVHDGSVSLVHFFRTLNRRINEMITKHPEINVIHFNDGLIASLALYHKGYEHIKRVVTVHGLDVVFPFRFFQKNILPRFNRYDHIIAVSNATAQATIERGVNAEKVSVVVNGIDHQLSSIVTVKTFDEILQHHRVPTNKKYLVMLGRPVRRKGFSWFIKQVLPKIDSNYHILMIGPFYENSTLQEKFLGLLPSKLSNMMMLFLGYPSDQKKIRQLLKDPAYTSKINHLGKLPLAELKTILQHTTAFLMPNIAIKGDMEGFGLVCLEASSCQAIVLASAIEGITDAIQHQKNGFLIESENATTWQNILADIISNPEYYKQHRERFQQFTLENYSWDKMIEGYNSIFKRILF